MLHENDLEIKIDVFRKIPQKIQIFASPWRITIITLLCYAIFSIFWTFAGSSFLSENIQVIIGLIAILAPFFSLFYNIFLIFYPEGSYLFIHMNIISHLTWLYDKKQKMDKEEAYLERIIFEDNNDSSLSPEKIMEIRALIIWISENIRNYEQRMDYIKKCDKHSYIYRSQRIFLTELYSLIQKEKKELHELAARISLLIQKWTTLHQKELLEVEQELEKQVATTENLSGQGAIDLQRVRLHEHIENLNKIRNIL